MSHVVERFAQWAEDYRRQPLAPEVLHHAKRAVIDHRSDIYSAGIVVWELLAGRPLIQGGTVGEMVAMMANPKLPSLRDLRPEVSEAVEKMVLRALQPDPASRYSRADDFARAINEQLVREGLVVGAEDVGNYVRAMCPEEFAAVASDIPPIIPRYDLYASKDDWLNQRWTEMIAG